MKSRVSKLFVLLSVVILISGCSSEPYKSASDSMNPTIRKGDRIFVDQAAYKAINPERGDVIVFKYPVEPEKVWICRIIGLGGEKLEIKDGNILINGKVVNDSTINSIEYLNHGAFGAQGQAVLIPKNHYYVLGDRSINSRDSRFWGFVPEANVVGKVSFCYWPLSRFGKVK